MLPITKYILLLALSITFYSCKGGSNGGGGSSSPKEPVYKMEIKDRSLTNSDLDALKKIKHNSVNIDISISNEL